MARFIHYIYFNCSEIVLLMIIISSLIPLVFPDWRGGMTFAFIGFVYGVCVAFYPPINDKDGFDLKLPSSILMASVVLMGFASLFVLGGYDSTVGLVGWEKMFATYFGFIVSWIGITVGKGLSNG